MIEGIGVQTVGGVLAVILGGKITPLSCYVGVGSATGTGVNLELPVGALGCEYDFEQIRVFFEHLSSPATGKDFPGFNHAGVKWMLIPAHIQPYIGFSVAHNSRFNTMDNPLGIVGVETQGDVRFYVEHVTSLNDFGNGYTHGGIKFVF